MPKKQLVINVRSSMSGHQRFVNEDWFMRLRGWSSTTPKNRKPECGKRNWQLLWMLQGICGSHQNRQGARTLIQMCRSGMHLRHRFSPTGMFWVARTLTMPCVFPPKADCDPDCPRWGHWSCPVPPRFYPAFAWRPSPRSYTQVSRAGN